MTPRKNTPGRSAAIGPETDYPMYLDEWRPWFEQELDLYLDDFRDSLGRAMQPYVLAELQGLSATGRDKLRCTPLDVIDEGGHYIVRAGLPGYSREEVEVRITGEEISISAKKEVKKEDALKNYIHRESSTASCERSFFFPEEVDPATAEGVMKNGVLELTVPKKSPKPATEPRKIAIR